jgi:glycosyltransferase involved in cell wall biosynthesis
MPAAGYPPATRGRIVMWGFLASYPFGGMTWQALHHIAAARRLGYDVWYVEESDSYLMDPVDHSVSWAYEANVSYLDRQMKRIGLQDRWVFRPCGASDVLSNAAGLDLASLYRSTDIAVNICGAQGPQHAHAGIGKMVYVQTDPVAPQIAVANGDPRRIAELDHHQVHFTYGENIGTPRCDVPALRYRWRPTRPPVVLDWWDTENHPPLNPSLTTVANWKHTINDVEYEGRLFRWSKDYYFRKFISLPERSPLPLELALGAISDDDRSLLEKNGWRQIRSGSLADPETYRDYIRSSLGEFTVSKEQVVASRSGWFSDRSACYLAAGRPVITQDTGFSDVLPVGEGLFVFSTQEEARAAIEEVARNYEKHSRAAREIAHEYFNADRLIEEILEAGLAV